MIESSSAWLTENLIYRTFCCSQPLWWSINTAGHAQFEGQCVNKQGLNRCPPRYNSWRRRQSCQRGSHTHCDLRLQGTQSIHQSCTSFTSTGQCSHPEYHCCATGVTFEWNILLDLSWEAVTMVMHWQKGQRGYFSGQWLLVGTSSNPSSLVAEKDESSSSWVLLLVGKSCKIHWPSYTKGSLKNTSQMRRHRVHFILSWDSSFLLLNLSLSSPWPLYNDTAPMMLMMMLILLSKCSITSAPCWVMSLHLIIHFPLFLSILHSVISWQMKRKAAFSMLIFTLPTSNWLILVLILCSLSSNSIFVALNHLTWQIKMLKALKCVLHNTCHQPCHMPVISGVTIWNNLILTLISLGNFKPCLGWSFSFG